MRTIAFILFTALALYMAGDRAAAQPEAPAEAQTDLPPATQTKPPGCLAGPVVLKRFGVPDPLVVSLTDCEQQPHLAALPLVSALALPRPVPRDADALADTRADTSDADVDAGLEGAGTPELLNPELLVRLQQLAARFPDRPIEIVSGLRARARAGSRHRSGDALDVRIEGVDNEELSTFARTLEATGVGYYPNSTFVHVDVRAASAFWVDRSGPGEKPQYVRNPDDGEPAAAPEPVRTGASEDAELAAIAAPVERALRETLDELHGPELPIADEPGPEPAPAAESTVATDAMQSVEAARSPDASSAEPASDAPVDPGELDAEIRNLLDRALVVMRQANAAG